MADSPAVFSGGSLYVFLPDFGLKNSGGRCRLLSACGEQRHQKSQPDSRAAPRDDFRPPKRCPVFFQCGCDFWRSSPPSTNTRPLHQLHVGHHHHHHHLHHHHHHHRPLLHWFITSRFLFSNMSSTRHKPQQQSVSISIKSFTLSSSY